MFAKTIIDSDAFLDLPLSAQALYFHLSMRADDDGFVNNPKKIQRMIGATDGDAQLLLQKGFLIAFNSGVIVIKHWKIHNYIQKDRYRPTVYRAEMAQLSTKENGGYTLTNSPVSILDTACIQDVSRLDAQDRDRIGESPHSPPKGGRRRYSEHKTAPDWKPADFEKLWRWYPNGELPRVATRGNRQRAIRAWDKLHPDDTLITTIAEALARQAATEQWQRGVGIPHLSTYLNGYGWEEADADDH